MSSIDDRRKTGVMLNRRTFLATAGMAGARMLPNWNPQESATPSPGLTNIPSTPKRLRLLVLGGTGHIGPYHVAAALSRGHRVSVFSRGHAFSQLSPEVKHLIGDRNGELDSIRTREWDAVLDLATIRPLWVRTLGQVLKQQVGHYTFVSSERVYQDPPVDDNHVYEESNLVVYRDKTDPFSPALSPTDDQYGALKALCEQEAERQFPARALIVRPGVIVGPDDSKGSLTYWVARMERGGKILAAGDPLTQIQLIDVRDLAEWVIFMIEKSQTGTFNSIGPAMSMGWAEMLGAIRGITSAPLALTWVPTQWVISRGVRVTGNLLFFSMEVGMRGLMHMTNSKALSQGLRFRPLSVTASDTLLWYKQQPRERQAEILLGFENSYTSSSLEDSMARERNLLTAWSASRKEKY